MGVIYAENGTVLRSFVGTNQKATDDRHQTQTQLTQATDNQNIENWQHAGFRSIAHVDNKQFITCFSDHYKLSIAERDATIHQDLEGGETKIFAHDSDGNVLSYIKTVIDNTIELNGNADYAVSWTDLNTVLQTLVTNINAALASKGDGSGSAGTLTLDLSPAKVETVKLP